MDSIESRQKMKYPQRGKFFANKYCRLLDTVRAASEIGAVGAYMLTVIAIREDSLRYRCGIKFWDAELQAILNRSQSQIKRVRQCLVDHGWLHTQRRNNRSITTYWVLVPLRYTNLIGVTHEPNSEPNGANGRTIESTHEPNSEPNSAPTSIPTLTLPKKESEPSRSKFVKPTKLELQQFIGEYSLRLDAEQFLDYYESNGWLVGKNKMRNWQATARNWSRKNRQVNGIAAVNEQPLRKLKSGEWT